jgi:curved DNA-binding protein CbpA
MGRTFYEVLGVSETATTAEIRDAYRDRLKETHPDHNDDADASEQTKRVIRAYDVLTDERERERYDSVGHDTYIDRHCDGLESEQVPSTSEAAEETDWTATSTGPTNRESVGGRRRARERRRRERQATETVEETTESGSTRTGTDSFSHEGGQHRRNGAGGRNQGTTVDGAQSWNAQSGFNVRQSYKEGLRRNRIFPNTQSIITLIIAFLLYPFMVFAALFQPFPLVVNLVVAICTILLIGYLQSMPEVGIAVFGGWSVGVPLGLIQLNVPFTSLTGVLALSATWLPLGLSAITFLTIRKSL